MTETNKIVVESVTKEEMYQTAMQIVKVVIKNGYQKHKELDGFIYGIRYTIMNEEQENEYFRNEFIEKKCVLKEYVSESTEMKSDRSICINDVENDIFYPKRLDKDIIVIEVLNNNVDNLQKAFGCSLMNKVQSCTSPGSCTLMNNKFTNRVIILMKIISLPKEMTIVSKYSMQSRIKKDVAKVNNYESMLNILADIANKERIS